MLLCGIPFTATKVNRRTQKYQKLQANDVERYKKEYKQTYGQEP